MERPTCGLPRFTRSYTRSRRSALRKIIDPFSLVQPGVMPADVGFRHLRPRRLFSIRALGRDHIACALRPSALPHRCRHGPRVHTTAGQQLRRPEGVHRLSSRATGITAHLANGGALKHAQATAAHESPRTTKLYDRTKERLTQDEVERCHIAAYGCLPQLRCRQLVGSGSTRARKSLTPALPYIARFSVFSRLMWPSVGPLLQLTVTAFLTASRSVAACARTAAWHRCRTGARP